MYVQHLMKQNSREVFDLVYKKHAHIFVCGGIEMARDVKEAITEIIQECQKVDYSDAVEIAENLKVSFLLYPECTQRCFKVYIFVKH